MLDNLDRCEVQTVDFYRQKRSHFGSISVVVANSATVLPNIHHCQNDKRDHGGDITTVQELNRAGDEEDCFNGTKEDQCPDRNHSRRMTRTQVLVQQ